MVLLVLFIAVPLIEIALFIQLGSVLALGWILLVVVLTAMLGTWLVRRQGRDVLRRLQGALDRLEDPTEPLAHGAMILLSGALLLTPGFFTDAVGFLLLLPAVRLVAFRWVRARVLAGGIHVRPGPQGRAGPDAPRGAPPGAQPGHPDGVIDADYEDVTSPDGKLPPSRWTRPH